MKKNKKFRILIPVGLIVLMGVGLLISLSFYYKTHFPVNVWINGEYCTGMTLSEVNQRIADGVKLPSVRITDQNDHVEEIDLSQADGMIECSRQVGELLGKESSVLYWVKCLFHPVYLQVGFSRVLWDDAKLRTQFGQLNMIREELNKSPGVRITYEDGLYSFSDGNEKRLDFEKAYQYLCQCISQGIYDINLEEGGCYGNLQDSPEDAGYRGLWELISLFLSQSIQYDMGTERIVLSQKDLCSFIEKDTDHMPIRDGETLFILNEEAIAEWVHKLCDLYDTAGKTRSFLSSRGDEVEVTYVTYGTLIDFETEEEFLKELLREPIDPTQPEVIRIPVYKQAGYARGLDDIGNTYIEIDMTLQHMYYYIGGELAVETDIVTGNTGRRMGTPEGIYFVYDKQKNRVLRGPGYASPVKFWVPVKGAIGIHDASWRKKFGGEIYKKNGSHGCINTPKEAMTELYDLVEIGTPVIMFY